MGQGALSKTFVQALQCLQEQEVFAVCQMASDLMDLSTTHTFCILPNLLPLQRKVELDGISKYPLEEEIYTQCRLILSLARKQAFIGYSLSPSFHQCLVP